MGKVKAQLLDEQEQHDLFMRDQEPDFDDYALAKQATILDTNVAVIHQLIESLAKCDGDVTKTLIISKKINNLLFESVISMIDYVNTDKNQHAIEDVLDDDSEELSDCCSAFIYPDTDICSDCKEHCGIQDDYALATRMVIAKEKDDQREMEAVFMEGEYCQTCEHCEKTKDPYGTGDSPTVRECLASPDQCPGVMK